MTQTQPRFAWLPGLLLCVALAAGAVFLAEIAWVKDNLRLSALLLVILIGMIVGSFVALPESFGPGLKLAQRPILRLAVAGLGLRLSLAKLGEIGGPALVIVVVSTLAALVFAWWLAPLLKVPRKVGLLLGVGGAICGASAVVAADSVVQGEKGEAAISVGIITLLGTVGILVYPLLGHALGMSPFFYGLFSGATLHEVAHVAAAGTALGPEALETATVVKLARITLLAPIVFYLAWSLNKKSEKTGDADVPLVPWFLVVFVILAALNTAIDAAGYTAQAKPTVDALLRLDLFLLTVGMAGVGLQTRFKQLKEAGPMPILLGFAQWIFLAVVAYGLAVLLLPGGLG